MVNNLFLEDFLRSLENWGLVDVFLPFLLVFTIVYAVLEKVKILGDDKRNLNIVVAIVLGLSVVIPHITNSFPIDFDPVDIINGALPAVSILVIAIIMLMILIGVFAHDKIFLGLTMPGWIGFFSILAIIFIFGASAGWWGGSTFGSLSSFFGEDVIEIFIVIVIFGIIISFIASGSHDKEDALSKLGFNFKELFGKGK